MNLSRKLKQLFKQLFTVTAKADRMGRGWKARNSRTNRWELPSEAVAPGTVQVAHGPTDRAARDCQTIGGYPKIAHVTTVDLPRAAQLCPNDTVRFQRVTGAEASTLYVERERDLQRFRVGLSLRRR
jgi:antagonist of KipI